jgi:hypothetical protein
LLRSSLGDVPHRLTAAEERHQGKTFLRVKASFKQPAVEQMVQLAQSGLSATFEIKMSNGPHKFGVMRHEAAP